MGILNHDEIVRRLRKDQLIRDPRKTADGQFDVEPASYDLSAGKAVWRSPRDGKTGGDVKVREYKPPSERPTLTVQPGQMVFVITHEDILMPRDLCGTVYSKNSLAADGILALNAGHVDPGYQGPIVIRLINLRATPWTLQLGSPIFTVVFQTVDVSADDVLLEQPAIPANATLLKVLKSADAALSNALLDLYEVEMDKRLSAAEERTRASLSTEYVRRADLGQAFWVWLRGSILGLIIAVAALIGLAASVVKIIEFLGPTPSTRVPSTGVSPPVTATASPTTAASPTSLPVSPEQGRPRPKDP